MDYCVGAVGESRNDFQKADDQGENSFAKEFSPWTPFQKTPICLRNRRGRTRSLDWPHTSVNETILLGILCEGREQLSNRESHRAPCGEKETIHYGIHRKGYRN